MQKRIQVTIKQVPGLHIYIVYNSLLHNADLAYIQIKCSLVTEAQGVPPMKNEQTFVADNSTRVPMVYGPGMGHPDGSPYMIDNMVQTGYETKTVTITDSTGEPQQVSEPDYSKPVFENQPQQGTIGECDKILWENFDKRNPQPVADEHTIEQGMLRRLGFPAEPYVFVVTEAWLSTQEG